MIYVNLNRNFKAISLTVNDDTDFSNIYSEGFSKDENWDSLLAKYRVIILAEAGSGKTVEIKNKSEELSELGNNSFFIRLEDIKDNFESAFDHGDIGLFNKWLNSLEEAYFFLDSVDEAKLSSEKDFKKAVRVFSSKLKGGISRAKIYITSRGSVWKPKTDLEMVNDYLKSPSSESNSFEVFSLSNLNTEQIKLFSDTNKIKNSIEFIQEIASQEAEVFTKRPLDLLELIEYWNLKQKIGSRKELLDHSIIKYLQDVEEGRDKCDVDFNKLMCGAQEIAAALTFCRKSKIAIPDKETDQNSLQIKTILGDWASDEISTLLNRPIFEPSIYGSQRFTQRLLREYLTALWINEKVNSGSLDKERLREMFFQNIYGIEVPILSLKAVLSWYVLLDSEFSKIVEELRPEIFIEGGDPSNLSVDHRIDLLKRFCLMYKEKNSCFITFDSSALLRFGSSEMEGTVKELLNEHYDNRPLMQILLQMAINYKMRSCSETALQISLDESCDVVSRKLAVKLIKTILTKSEIVKNSKDVKSNCEFKDEEFTQVIIDEYGEYLSVSEVIELLSNVSTLDRFAYIGIQLSAENYINAIPYGLLLDALNGFYQLIDRKPYTADYKSEISGKYLWLTSVLEVGLLRYLECKDESLLKEDVISKISKVQNFYEIDTHSSSDEKLLKFAHEWRSLSHKLFWHDIEKKRAEIQRETDTNSANKAITFWYQVSWMRNFWSFKYSDLESVMGWIESKEINDDKLVAISLAWDLIEQNNSDIGELADIVSSVAGGDEMLEAFRNPQKHDWQLQNEARNVKFSEEKERRKIKKKENLTYSIKYIKENSHLITDISYAKEGKYNGVQEYLLSRVMDVAENHHSWAFTNWKGCSGQVQPDTFLKELSNSIGD